MRLNLAKPHVAFIGIWVLTYLLFRLRLSENIVESNFSIDTLIFLSCGFAALISFSFNAASDIPPIPKIHLARLSRFQQYLACFWLVGTGLDITFSGGIPLYWAIAQTGKNYTEFGIPSFHGIVNASYLFLITSLFLSHLLQPKYWRIIAVLFLLSWPIAMLGRGILLSALVQMAGVYLMMRRVSVRSLIGLAIITVGGIMAFGYLGDLRSGGPVLAYLAPEGGILQILPSGFLWVYVYITTGINNLANSVDVITPLGHPFFSILNLLPSVFRTGIDGEDLNLGLMQLVDRNLNTSSFYAGYVSDFGFWGGLLAPILLMLTASVAYKSAQTGKIGSLISYALLFQCIIFSPFFDMLLLLPTIAQLFIGLIVCNQYLQYTRRN